MVGYVTLASGATEGVIISISHGRVTGVKTVPGASLYGVSCASAALCYAAGFTSSGGIVVTINGGVPRASVTTAADLLGIACRGVACVAVGQGLPAAGSPSAAFQGVVVSLASGAVTNTTEVAQSGGFDAVALAPDGTYAAVGPAHGAGSEVTIG